MTKYCDGFLSREEDLECGWNAKCDSDTEKGGDGLLTSEASCSPERRSLAVAVTDQHSCCGPVAKEARATTTTTNEDGGSQHKNQKEKKTLEKRTEKRKNGKSKRKEARNR